MPSVHEPQDYALLNEAKSLWFELISLLHDRLQLAALETQHAGRSLVAMIITGVIIAILLVSAWLGLLSAAVLWMVHMGLTASVAILLGAMVNLLLAVLLSQLVRYQSRHLGWPATLRSFHKPVPVKESEHASP